MTGRIVFAPDSFKGTLDAASAARALARGWASVRPRDETILRPMADGGEGTLEAFESAIPGVRRRFVTVTGPADEPVEACWLLLPPSAGAPKGTAVVELAGASGIGLLGDPPRLRPLAAHTAGFGEAIVDALAHGVSRLVLAIGGSCSTDGGVGALSALGARFVDAGGAPVPRGGRGLAVIAHADLSALPPLPPGGVRVLTDVASPLLGPDGAAAVFGPQKGASALQVAALDAGLAVLADRLGIDQTRPGAGAAGGTGYGLLAWGAQLERGAPVIAELVGLRDAVATASVVVTGEGSFDAQTASGKVAAEVLRLARETGVRAALVAGVIADAAGTAGFAGALALTELAGSRAVAMAEPERWLEAAGARLAQDLG